MLNDSISIKNLLMLGFDINSIIQTDDRYTMLLILIVKINCNTTDYGANIDSRIG